MSYLVKKKIKNQTYYYEYESYRVEGKVKHRCVRYLGKTPDIGTKKDLGRDITVLKSLQMTVQIITHAMVSMIS